jgi:Probable Zinc-ribbon domain
MSTETRQRARRRRPLAYTLPMLAQADPALARQWVRPLAAEHGERTPQNTTAGSTVKVLWRCATDASHEWEATVGTRVRGSGCPHCARLGRGIAPLSRRRPDLAREWVEAVGANVRGLTPETVTPGSGALVRWRCSTDPAHVFEATVRRRARGFGCPHCPGDEQPPSEI